MKRGAWLARKIIAEPPDDPPPNVPALKEDTTALTLRERLEQHRNQTGLRAVPHEDRPVGRAVRGVRRRRAAASSSRSTRDPRCPTRPKCRGVDDLKRYLAEDRIDQVAFSVLKHLATYATGRNSDVQRTELPANRTD